MIVQPALDEQQLQDGLGVGNLYRAQKVLACSSSMLLISAPSITVVASASLSIFVFFDFLSGLGIILEALRLGGMMLQEVV